MSTLPNFEWTLLERYRIFLWLSFQNLAACFRYTRVLSIYSSFEMHWIDTIYWIIVCWVKNCKKAPNLRESHHTIVDPSAIWTFCISFSKWHSLKLKKVIFICTLKNWSFSFLKKQLISMASQNISLLLWHTYQNFEKWWYHYSTDFHCHWESTNISISSWQG